MASAHADRRARHEQHRRHHRRAQPERDLAGAIERQVARQQVAREPAADQAADAGRGVGDPGEGADRLDVEAARVVEILRQPEQVEVPGRVAQELGDDEAPGLRGTAAASSQRRRRFGGAAGADHRRQQPPLRRRRAADAARAGSRPSTTTPPTPGRSTAGEVEHRAPVGVGDDQREQRRRDDAADRRAGVDDAHRRRALGDREPLGDRPRRGGEAAAFAHAEQQPADREHADAGGQAVAGAGQRPEHHDRQEARRACRRRPSACRRRRTSPRRRSGTPTAAARTARW